MKRKAKSHLSSNRGQHQGRTPAKNVPATFKVVSDGPHLFADSPAPPEEPIDTNAASAWVSLAAEALSVWERSDKPSPQQPKAKAAKQGD